MSIFKCIATGSYTQIFFFFYSVQVFLKPISKNLTWVNNNTTILHIFFFLQEKGNCKILEIDWPFLFFFLEK